MEDCVFCKIVRGEIPAQVVLETENVLVFKDINPQAPVHLLAIPKQHVERLEELHDLAGQLVSAASRAAADQGLENYRLVLNMGKDAGQEVPHLHFHIIGGRKMSWPPG